MALLVAKIKKTSIRTPFLSADTSLKVRELVDSQDNTVLIANFGEFVVAVLKQGDNIEIVKCSAITQNADGTANLTVATNGRNLLPISPYTGGATGLDFQTAEVIVTNDPLTMSRFASLDNANTWDEIQTFTAFPITPSSAPTTDYQVANKAYVDGIAIAGAPNATATVRGIVEIATTSESQAGTDSGATTAALSVLPSDIAKNIQGAKFVYAADAQASDTYVIALAPAVTAYAAGQRFVFKANTANTGAATLNVNGLGAITIKKYVNGAVSDLENNDILAGTMVDVVYNSTGPVFQMMQTRATDLTSGVTYETEQFFGSTDITGAEAQTLTGGITSDAKALHFHGMKVINSSRSSASGSGTQSISGVGFKPHLVMITASDGTQTNDFASTTGSYDATTQGCSGFGVRNNGGSATMTSINSATQIVLLDHSDSGGTKTYAAVIGNLGADGFDLVWTKTGAATQDVVMTITCWA